MRLFLINFVKLCAVGLNWLRIGLGGLTTRTGRNKFAGDMSSGDLTRYKLLGMNSQSISCKLMNEAPPFICKR